MFTVGNFASYDITTHGYPVTQSGGALPMGLSFDPATETISGRPDGGTARSYTLSFQGEDPSTTIAFTLVVANGSNPPCHGSNRDDETGGPNGECRPDGHVHRRGKRIACTDVQWQISIDNGQTFANIVGATSTKLSVPGQGRDDRLRIPGRVHEQGRPDDQHSGYTDGEEFRTRHHGSAGEREH